MYENMVKDAAAEHRQQAAWCLEAADMEPNPTTEHNLRVRAENHLKAAQTLESI